MQNRRCQQHLPQRSRMRPDQSTPKGEDFLKSDLAYHFFTFVFYFGAFVLQAAVSALANLEKNSNSTTLKLDNRKIGLNVAATIFAFAVTVCYGCSTVLGFRRWRGQ